MKNIPFEDSHRKEHFDFFTNMDMPHFSVCARVEVSKYLDSLKRLHLPFNISTVYAISCIGNRINRFRQRIKDKALIEHQLIHPSYSIPTQASSVFSFCTVEFNWDYDIFKSNALEKEKFMQTHPNFKDEEGRDDYLFLSAIPWIHFTGFTHAMHVPVKDSVPRIVWGKYQKEGEKIFMPVGVQAHHAIVDGKDVGLFFEKLQEFLNHFEIEINKAQT